MTNAKNAEDTVWSLGQLKMFLGSIGCHWEEDVLPRVHSMVVRTLQAVADSMEDKKKDGYF